jgi:pimeloyl-ACP methyl ester carboxylesterase/DNA-binding CsgD family transcriptional regulator
MPAAQSSSPSQQVRFCTSSDGVRIAYATAGSGPPLVLSATWLTHLEYQWRSLAWQPLLETLSRHFRLVRYDLRGCGLSDRDAEDVSFEAWTRDIEAVVDAAGLQRFSLLGVCQGGPIAIEYAARHPDRVSELVLYGTYARGMSRRTSQQAAKAKVFLELLELGWAQEDHAFLQVFATQFQPEGSIEHLRSWCELQRVATSAANATRLARVTFDVDAQASASQVACPTLVVHPDRDAVVPMEEARLLAKLVPGARLVQLESPNHMLLPHEPAWTRFIATLREFLPGSASASGAFAALTGREKELLHHVARGQDNHQIAAHLALSEKTVRNHLTSIFAKLGVESRAQAIVLAKDAGYGVPSRRF